MSTSRIPLLLDERQRLNALHRYRILDTPPEPAFERLVALCVRLFQVPIALVSLVDEDRQWFKAVRGLETQETPRALAFCAHAIAEPDVLVVPDAATNELFADNALVTGDPCIRFYAGAPIRTPDGFNLGTVSIIDVVPRTLSDDERATLSDLAAIAADELELRLSLLRITEAEEKELAASQRFRAVAEESIVGVYVIEGGVFSYVNPRMAEMLEYARDELLGRSPFDFAAEESKKLVAAEMEKRLSGAQAASEYRFKAVRREGTEITLDVRGVRAEINGSPAIIGTLIDVTSEAEAEERLRASERRYRALADTASDSIIVIDKLSKVLFANKATERMFGYDASELIGNSLTIIIPDELRERHLAAVHRSAAADPTRVLSRVAEFTAKTKEGEPIPVEISFGRFEERGQIRFVGIVRDTRQRKLLEQQIERAKQISAMGRVAATLAHEFNNVLMGIQSSIELLARAGSREDARDRATANAKKAIARGKRVTEGALRFCNPQPLQFNAIRVDSWLRDIEDELRSTMPSAIEVRVARAPEHLTIRGDRYELSQVLLNLASNARDAMPGGGVIDVRSAVNAADPGDTVEITVCDSGRGIPDEVLPRIFEPFFSTKGAAGTGIGLALAQQIVDRHSGVIRVETGPRGTCFRISLPTAHEAEEGQPEGGFASETPRRVLLVDDDEVVAAATCELLQAYAIETDWLSSSRDIIERIERFRPDVVVLDVTLHNESGTAVARRLIEQWPDLPIIFSTGHPPDDAEFRTIRARPNVTCLVKPYTAEALFDEYSNILANRSSK